MTPEAPRDLLAEPRVVVPEHLSGDRGALGPDDGGDVRRAAQLRVLARPHRQDCERAGRQEMLQRQVVVRPVVADGADDAGLVVGQPGHRDAGRLTQRRVAALCRDHQPAAQLLRSLTHWRRCAPPLRPAAVPRRRRPERTRAAPAAPGISVQGHAQATRLHHPAERTGIRAGLVVVEMQVQARRPPPEPAVADPNVQDRIGRHRQPVPYAGCDQQPARPGSHRIGAAIERRMLRRRQRGPVDQDGRDPRRSQAAGQRTAYGTRAHYAHLGFDGPAHAGVLPAAHERAADPGHVPPAGRASAWPASNPGVPNHAATSRRRPAAARRRRGMELDSAERGEWRTRPMGRARCA